MYQFQFGIFEKPEIFPFFLKTPPLIRSGVGKIAVKEKSSRTIRISLKTKHVTAIRESRDYVLNPKILISNNPWSGHIKTGENEQNTEISKNPRIQNIWRRLGIKRELLSVIRKIKSKHPKILNPNYTNGRWTNNFKKIPNILDKQISADNQGY